MALSLIYMKIIIYKEHQSERFIKNSASQYTVMVSNLYNTTNEELESFFRSKLQDKDLKIAEMSYVYPMKEFMGKMSRLQGINNELLKRTKEPSRLLCWKKSTAKLIEEKEKIIEWKAQFTDEHNLDKIKSSVVFVTFEQRKSREDVLGYWRKSKIVQAFYSISYFFPFCFAKTDYSFNGKLLRICHAPEPTDIIWHNIGRNKLVIMIKKVGILIASKFVILFASAIIIACRGTINNVTESAKEVYGIPFSFVYSLFIVITNLLVSLIIRLLLIKFESPTTQTKKIIAIFYKEATATTLNTILLIFFYACYDSKFLEVDSKFPNMIFNLILLETFVTPLVAYFDIPFLYNKYRRWRIKRSDHLVSQEDANDAWTNPAIDVSDRLGVYVRVFTLALFASKLYPLVLLHAIWPMITNYWTDKYLFLRRHSRSPEFGKKLTKANLNFLGVSLALYNVSQK